MKHLDWNWAEPEKEPTKCARCKQCVVKTNRNYCADCLVAMDGFEGIDKTRHSQKLSQFAQAYGYANPTWNPPNTPTWNNPGKPIKKKTPGICFECRQPTQHKPGILCQDCAQKMFKNFKNGNETFYEQLKKIQDIALGEDHDDET